MGRRGWGGGGGSRPRGAHGPGPPRPPAESVKDLIRYLRHEDETRDVRQQLGAAQILQNDLLPILVQYPQDKVLFDAVIRYRGGGRGAQDGGRRMGAGGGPSGGSQ